LKFHFILVLLKSITRIGLVYSLQLVVLVQFASSVFMYMILSTQIVFQN